MIQSLTLFSWVKSAFPLCWLVACLAEVQGRGGNEDFPLRMHRYRGLLEGRYRRPVIALALLIEPLSKTQSSGIYRWECYGTKVSYEFPVFRIMERKGIEKGIQLGRTEGIQLGEARGIKLGEARGIAATARRMLVRGVPLEQVVDFTGLSLGEVEALRRGMDN